MQIHLLFFLSCIVILSDAYAQSIDSLWQNIDEEAKKYQFTDTIDHYSHGWFPAPDPAQSLLFWFSGGDVIDCADAIRANSFHPTTMAFSSNNPYQDQQKLITTPNGRFKNSDFPTTSYWEVGIAFRQQIPIGIILVGGGFQHQESMLFSLDTTRSYLLYSGRIGSIKEVNVLNLNEKFISGSIGFLIPVYGVFFNSKILSISSCYYVGIQLDSKHLLSSRKSQFVHIANENDGVRYHNNADTIQFDTETEFQESNKNRYNCVLSLGWNTVYIGAISGGEIFLSFPFTSTIPKTNWKQYQFGIKVVLGRHWVN